MTQGRPASKTRPKFGERIALARQKAGLTQRQLATKLGVTQRVITYWEREAVGLSADQLVTLAGTLRVSADTLLGRQKSVGHRSSQASKLQHAFECAQKLPHRHQTKIIAYVDAMAAKHHH